MCVVYGDARLLKKTVLDCLCMFYMSTPWMTDMPTLEKAHTVTNLQNTASVKNALDKDKQADHSPTMELTMSISTVHAIQEDLRYHKVCSQCVQCLRHTQTALHLDTDGTSAVITQWGWCFSVVDCDGQWDVVLPLWTKRNPCRHAMKTSHCTLN